MTKFNDMNLAGTTGPFANFIRNPLPEGGNGAGATAKGSDVRFLLFCYPNALLN